MLNKKAVIATTIALIFSTNQAIAAPNNGTANPNNDQRVDYGWGGSGGGNLEMYNKQDSGRAGELRFIYGGGDYGQVRFYHYDPSRPISQRWTEQTRIDENGNWGIGTTNICSDCKLSVNGKIRATEVVVESGWADYVFQPSYQLRPLEEVEAYINKNQHLPGVDSAATIKKNGLNLSKISVKMMEKIEELTLYMIELKKQNEVLQYEVALLKQKNK